MSEIKKETTSLSTVRNKFNTRLSILRLIYQKSSCKIEILKKSLYTTNDIDFNCDLFQCRKDDIGRFRLVPQIGNYYSITNVFLFLSKIINL